jgi:lipoprotein-anchoring transpeptidase ErfK/SrfK
MRIPGTQTRAAALATVILMTVATAEAEERKAKPTGSACPWTACRTIVVSIPDRKLAILEGERVLGVFDTAVGKPASPSPSGTFTIVNRLTHPTYYTPGKVIEPGEGNPLGTRWIGLSLPGYGIHGTNKTHSIGRAASHGCIRMRNREVEELFELVRVGDVVELHATTDERLHRIFGSGPAPVSESAQLHAPASASATAQ